MPHFSSSTENELPVRQLSVHDHERTRVTPPTPSHTRVKNRRKRYLDLHPEYFGPSLELADPLLYDRLIRRFQSAAEREEEGRKKGYSGVLEADLYRGEAKVDALKNPDATIFAYKRGPNGEVLEEEKDEVPANKDEGYSRWKWEMEARFVRGDDDDFDYKAMDESEEFDDHILEEREAADRYFDGEQPKFVKGEEAASRTKSQELTGETGVQDF